MLIISCRLRVHLELDLTLIKMNRFLTVVIWFLFYLFCDSSCTLEDADPDMFSTELKVSCFLVDTTNINTIDTTSVKDVWVGSVMTSGYWEKQFDYLGQCWNKNTDTLPTRKSEKFEMPSFLINKYEFIMTNEGEFLYYYEALLTGIPVSGSDTRLICRSYVVFNGNLIRYSEPLVLNDPLKYAH